MREHYARLGLTPGASELDIKRAFRQKAQQAHPDRNDARGATRATVELIKARDALLAALDDKRTVPFEDFLDRIVLPTLGRRDREVGRRLATLVNQDPAAQVRVVGMG